MVFTSLSHIEAGTEVTISYADTPVDLLRNYGFTCDCPGCPDPEKAKKEFEEEAARRAAAAAED